jgi:hypothetical protein
MLSFSGNDNIYIGSTFMPTLRNIDHIKKYFPESKKKKMSYKEILQKYSNKIQMTILEIVPEKKRYYWERFYMQLFSSWNFKLLNKQFYK